MLYSYFMNVHPKLPRIIQSSAKVLQNISEKYFIELIFTETSYAGWNTKAPKLVFNCSKSAMEAPEQCLKSVWSQ